MSISPLVVLATIGGTDGDRDDNDDNPEDRQYERDPPHCFFYRRCLTFISVGKNRISFKRVCGDALKGAVDYDLFI